ncbi:MAG: S-layer protein, partial [Candidatus Marinimicrobia bacterium]|nr:S-layer protein [Candidatus Neomarinimicrobiota bacterium]
MKHIVSFLFVISAVSATTINIPSDYTTIQEGLNASVDGDTVLVAQGTYPENLILANEIVLA